MNILIVGAGGREHALAWACARSNQVEQVFVAPGNAGTALEANVRNVAIDVMDIAALLDFAKQQHIELTIVGPEAPLAAGLVDAFQQADLACFGPTQAAVQIESSKAFSKALMQQCAIPTPAFASFTDNEAAQAYLLSQTPPYVIKADGLAAGKGVVIAEDLEQAQQTVEQMLGGRSYGGAGQRLVIEQFVRGTELSYMVVSDGQHVVPLASAKDHKARDNGDKGPNTGGMGAYSPSPLMTAELEQRILNQVMYPALRGLAAAGTPFVGFLYAGLMVSADNDLQVLEFNGRLGDPETQVILPRLKTDIVDLCQQALLGRLQDMTLSWSKQASLGVVLASDGYPHAYQKGNTIHGLPTNEQNNIKVFHAGTRQKEQDIVTDGGRVLCVTALADDISAAHNKAYQSVKTINWEDIYYRTDIGGE